MRTPAGFSWPALVMGTKSAFDAWLQVNDLHVLTFRVSDMLDKLPPELLAAIEDFAHGAVRIESGLDEEAILKAIAVKL